MKKRIRRTASYLLCLTMLWGVIAPTAALASAEEDELPVEVTAGMDEELPSSDGQTPSAPAEEDTLTGDEALPGGEEPSDEEELPGEEALIETYADGEGYEIYPTPQSITYQTGTVTLPATMQVTYGEGIDVYTKDRAVEAFEQAGVTLSESASTSVKLSVTIGDTGNNSKYDAYKLTINAGGVTVVGKDTDAAFYGLTTVKRILQQVENRQVKRLTVEDYADVAIRGFIEGYYGNPWTVDDRAALMEFGGEIKMNIYFYAPKDDPKHSTKWRELYTDEELETLIKPLAEAGNKSKCYYGFALHPFWTGDFNFSSDAGYAADLAILKAKFEQVMSVGVRQIAVLGDDVGVPGVGVQNSYVRLLTDLTEWVSSAEMQTKYPGLKTSIPFCPNDYMGDASSKQMEALQALPSSVPVIQTGGAIWGNVSHSYLNTYRTNMGEDAGVFMWVNWPCSDQSKGSLIMGNHDVVLYNDLTQTDIDTLRGVMVNPMQQSEPSKAGIFQLADYVWNVWNGEDHQERKDNVWNDCFKYVDHNSAIETPESAALRELSKHMICNNGSGWRTDWHESFELSPKLTAFRSKLTAGTLTKTDINNMREEFQTLYDAAVLYKDKDTGNTRILGEYDSDGSYTNNQEQMAPWLDAWVEFALANLEMMDALACDLDGDSEGVAEHYLNAQSNLSASKEHRFWYINHYEYAIVGGEHIVPFADEVISVVAEKAKTVLNPSGEDAGSGLLTGSVIANKGFYGSNTADKLIDGDDDTFAWFSSSSAVGDYIGLDLGEVKTLDRVRCLIGSTTKANDHWTEYKLQYSTDNSNWTDVKSYTGSGSVQVVDEHIGQVQARYVRMYNLAASSNWATFSEFTVWDITGSLLYRSESVRRISGADASADDNGASLTIDTVILEPGQFVGIKLPSARVLEGIRAEYTDAPGLVLEAGLSEDILEQVDDPEGFNGGARYIRLRNSSTQRLSFVLDELSVTFAGDGSIQFVSSTVGGATNNDDARKLGTANRWFDGDVSTKAKFCAAQVSGQYVLYDLGQDREIRNLRVVAQDSEVDYPRSAKVQISMSENGPWTDVISYNTPGEASVTAGEAGWKNVPNYPNFVGQYGELETPQTARYLRLLITGDFSGRWVQLGEILINDGAYVPIPHPSFTVDPTETRGNEPGRMVDGDMTTGFQPDMTDRTSGSLIYHVSAKTNVGKITIVQNGNTPSNARVSVRTGENEWHDLPGTLTVALNRLEVPAEYTNVYDIKLTWGNVKPTFYEIITEERVEEEGGGQTTSDPEAVAINRYGGEDCSILFDENWKFNLGEASGASAMVYNDGAWRTVNLPHDYSIDQEYSSTNEAESAYLPGGIGWYRKSFVVDEAWEDKTVTIHFGGVYMDTDVYLNGTKLGENHYGYNPFDFVLPGDLLNYGGENVIAVRVNNMIPSSRWYSGSGIYRSVYLNVSEKVHVDRYGVTITTTNSGSVTIKTKVINDGTSSAGVTLKSEIYELTADFKQGRQVAQGTVNTAATVASGKTNTFNQSLSVSNPKLWNSWDKGTPNLYLLKTSVMVDGEVVDTHETEFGFREMEFNVDRGFILNGNYVKLKGVCQHHDQGALGSEAWYRAMERQVEILMEMGCNSIRVTHNPAADELIEICNRKGMLVIDEIFDMWYHPKNGNTYDFARWFNANMTADNAIMGGSADKTWAQFMIETIAGRDKNAPCVIMYSLGNEINTICTGDFSGAPAKSLELIAWAKAADPTRPCTLGDNGQATTHDGFKGEINFNLAANGGVVGHNYPAESSVTNGHNNGWAMYASEATSHINSRGVYNNKQGGGVQTASKRLTSYDKNAVTWGYTASNGWWRTIRYDYNMGEYAWTGFDYLGEPTPWNGTSSGSVGTWPSPKSSYFGIIDTNGIPKDSYYLYRAMWNDNSHTLHVLPTWDRKDLMITGGKVEVVVYTDAPVVRLYLNDVEVGAAKSTDNYAGASHHVYRTFSAQPLENGGTNSFSAASGDQSLYATFNVTYAEGKLEAKAFEADGVTPITDTVGRSVVKTTTGIDHLVVTADRSTIKNDGRDLSYITIDVVDASGEIINSAEPEITVTVSGEGRFMAMDNGVQADHTPFTSNTWAAGAGRLVAITQSTETAGTYTVTATTADGKSASVTITTSGADDSSGGGTDPVSYEIAKTVYVQRGTRPELPEKVTVVLGDGTQVEKTVTWNDYDLSQLNTVGNEFGISGVIDQGGYNITASVGVLVLDKVAALLNYSTATRVGVVPMLPGSRPAVMADGSVLNAQFPVKWNMPSDRTFNRAGTVKITGTAEVFGAEYQVTAWVRVGEEEIRPNGADMTGMADTLTLGGVANAALQDIRDDDPNTSWTGKGDVIFYYNTAISLYQVKVTFDGEVPTSGMTVYTSGDSGIAVAGWTAIDAVRSVSGNTVTYTLKKMPSAVLTKIAFDDEVTVTEAELITGTTSFDLSSSARLDNMKINGKNYTEGTLNKTQLKTPLQMATVEPVTNSNVAYTVLPEDSSGKVIIVTESEDNNVRGLYTVQLGEEEEEDKSDDSNDYPYTKTTASAASAQDHAQASNDGPASEVVDGNPDTYWHTNWNGGSGPANPSNLNDRYIQLTLEEETSLVALRYLPRGSASGSNNGVVTEYLVKVSSDGVNFNETVAQGTWTPDGGWEVANFTKPVTTKYVRLYGVHTYADTAGNVDKLMSAREVRVVMGTSVPDKSGTDISSAMVLVTPGEFHWMNEETMPDSVSVSLFGVNLVEGRDYVLRYSENRTDPGEVYVYAEAVAGSGYTGIAYGSYAIVKEDVTVQSFRATTVRTQAGIAPELPEKVWALMSDGHNIQLEVEWDDIRESSYINPTQHSFTVRGDVESSDLRPEATVKVAWATSVDGVSVTTQAGQLPTLPTKVNVQFDDGTSRQCIVTWAMPEATDFVNGETVEITGEVAGINKIPATASVRVTSGPAYSNFTVSSITLDGAEKLSEFNGEKVLELELGVGEAIPVLAVTANNNAQVSVTQATNVPGLPQAGASWAKAVIKSENGSKTETYTVKFTRAGVPEGGYIVTLDDVDARITVDPLAGKPGDEITLSVAPGYEIADALAVVTDGANEGEIQPIENGKFVMPAGNVTLSATATPIRYTISYTLDGGVASENRKTYTIETASFTLRNPTKTGYTFAGWTGTALFGATVTVTIAKGSTGNRAYLANWVKNSDLPNNPDNPGSSSGGGGGGGSSFGGDTSTEGNKVTSKVDPTTGATTVTTVTPSGVTTAVTTAKDGKQTATVTLPKNASGTVELDMPTLKAEAVPTIAIKAAGSNSVSLAIPVEGDESIVAVRVNSDGTETVIPMSIMDEDGLRVLTQGNETIKLVDNKKTFDDIPNDHWAAKAVSFTASRELFNGMGSPRTFAPTAAMNRAMMTTVLWRMAEKPESSIEAVFSDVEKGAYYEEAVNWGVQTGVVKGTDYGFEPETEITRETLAVLLYRAAGSPAVVDEMPRRFTDGSQVSDWATQAMIWAVQSGIINGRDGVRLAPKDVASRAEVATMLQRYVSKRV